MAFTEDLSVFFDSGDFGVTATPAAGSAFTVIFDKAYLAALGVVESSGPACVARTSDLVARAIGEGSAITISGAPVAADNGSYTVAGLPKPDGTGVSVLELRRS